MGRQQGCLELAASATGPEPATAQPTCPSPSSPTQGAAQSQAQGTGPTRGPVAHGTLPAAKPQAEPHRASGLSPTCQTCCCFSPAPGGAMVAAQREPRAAVMMSISVQTSVVY